MVEHRTENAGVGGSSPPLAIPHKALPSRGLSFDVVGWSVIGPLAGGWADRRRCPEPARARDLLLNARCRGCRSTSQVPKLSPPSADTATAAVEDARSRLLALAQGGRVYELLDQSYRYLRHADADPELVLLTRQGLVRLGPRRTDHRQRPFLRSIHPDDESQPAHRFRAIREERQVIATTTGASADGCDTIVARSTKDSLRAA